MKKMMFVILSMFVVSAYAEVDCGATNPTHVYAQGDRDGGSVHAHKLLIVPGSGKQCTDTMFAYIENTHPSYDSFLAMAMTAFASGKKLRIVVSDVLENTNMRRIHFMNLNN